MYSKNIQKLIDLFSKFPGVGPKTATRFVFYLSKNNDALELGQALQDFQKSLKVCSSCFKYYENSNEFCEICSGNKNCA